MKIAIVKASHRDGFTGFWAAGRKWPSHEPRVVEIVDTEADPPPTEPGEHINQKRIGLKSLAHLEGTPVLSVNLREVGSLEDVEIVAGVAKIIPKKPVAKAKEPEPEAKAPEKFIEERVEKKPEPAKKAKK